MERTRLLHAPEEKTYGFQVATKIITEGVEAAKLAHAAGASFFDINVGCPIYGAWPLQQGKPGSQHRLQDPLRGAARVLGVQRRRVAGWAP